MQFRRFGCKLWENPAAFLSSLPIAAAQRDLPRRTWASSSAGGRRQTRGASPSPAVPSDPSNPKGSGELGAVSLALLPILSMARVRLHTLRRCRALHQHLMVTASQLLGWQREGDRTVSDPDLGYGVFLGKFFLTPRPPHLIQARLEPPLQPQATQCLGHLKLPRLGPFWQGVRVPLAKTSSHPLCAFPTTKFPMTPQSAKQPPPPPSPALLNLTPAAEPAPMAGNGPLG